MQFDLTPARRDWQARAREIARMFTIGGGTAQILCTVVASRLLGRGLPRTRDGYLNYMSPGARD
jgi:hypothetical protein